MVQIALITIFYYIIKLNSLTSKRLLVLYNKILHIQFFRFYFKIYWQL